VDGNDATESNTVNTGQAWWQVIYGGNWILPTRFAVRGRVSTANNNLSNFDIQGSRDAGLSWITLKEVRNLVVPQATWVDITLPVEQTQSFDAFRISMEGFLGDTSGNRFLCLSEFEVYGSLFPTSDVGGYTWRNLTQSDVTDLPTVPAATVAGQTLQSSGDGYYQEVPYSTNGYNGLVDYCIDASIVLTATASSTGFGGTPAKAIAQDGSASVWHTGTTTGPHWLAVNFGEAEVRPTRVSLQVRSDGQHQPTAYAIEGSHDGVNWDEIGSTSPGTIGGGQWSNCLTTTGDYYQHLRIYLDLTGVHVNIGEVEVYGEIRDSATQGQIVWEPVTLPTVPDPSAEADGRILGVMSGALAYQDAASGGPDPTGITDGYVWTADGADGAAWEALPAPSIGEFILPTPEIVFSASDDGEVGDASVTVTPSPGNTLLVFNWHTNASGAVPTPVDSQGLLSFSLVRTLATGTQHASVWRTLVSEPDISHTISTTDSVAAGLIVVEVSNLDPLVVLDLVTNKSTATSFTVPAFTPAQQGLAFAFAFQQTYAQAPVFTMPAAPWVTQLQHTATVWNGAQFAWAEASPETELSAATFGFGANNVGGYIAFVMRSASLGLTAVDIPAGYVPVARGDDTYSWMPPTGTTTEIGPGDWQTPTLLNSWVNPYPGIHNNPEYRIDSFGMVHLQGMVGGGSAGTIFTLPVGFRPTLPQTFKVNANSGSIRIDVNADGTVTTTSGGEAWADLGDGISFLSADATPINVGGGNISYSETEPVAPTDGFVWIIKETT
jgi:hypothetical protein